MWPILLYYMYIIMCKSHLHLISFLFVPALYYTLKFKEFFHLLVSSLFVLSDVIVEDIVGLCTCTCTYKKAMVYYCFCCGMYI